jgi:hypothetical protein
MMLAALQRRAEETASDLEARESSTETTDSPENAAESVTDAKAPQG